MGNRGHRKHLKKNARWIIREVLNGLAESRDSRANRSIRFEPLERRELMAADFFDSASAASAAGAFVNSSPTVLQSTGFVSQSNGGAGLQAEGENAADLVGFAKALTAAGAKLYGADWDSVSTEQRQLFQEGANYLPFIEVTNPDRSFNSVGTAQGITTLPTWKFANGQTATGLKTLEQIATLAGVAIPQSSNPWIVEIPNQTVPFKSPMHVPVDTYDPNGGPLTITVSSSNPSAISAELISNPKSVRMVVNGYGEMVYRLFADEAPRPVNQFSQLVNTGFYNQSATNKVTFHRVIDNFVIQGGDPTGTGSGGSNLGDFDDQFDVDLQHNRTGVLSYAKSVDDSNDSQFFVTEGPQRHLDFNHSIFGQLIQGEAVRQAISRTQTNSSKPVNDVIIKSMEIFDDTRNGLIRLKSLGTTGSSTITVTVTNSTGQSFSTTFVAAASADTSNGAPFLNDITVPPIAPGQTVTIQLSSQDKEGDAVAYGGTRSGSVPYQFDVNSTTGLMTVTAPQNFSGSFDINVGVRAASSSASGEFSDNQKLTFNVAAPVVAPTSIDLASTTDSGSSDSDNITNTASMQLVVNGTTVGATVNLKVGTQTVGTAVATGASTTITTTLISQLGAGTYSVVATQTLNGQTSPASPALVLTYDPTAPAAIPANQLPTRANVDSQLVFDLVHPEEGSGLRYVLDSAPAGLTVNQQTGVITWTPTAAQLGPQTATLRLVDVAGNSVTQALAINVADTARIAIDLQLKNTSGQAISTLSLNQEFDLKIVLNDLRTSGTGTGEGVFSAYMDIVYDSTKVELVGANPITYDPLFGNGQTATTTTAGLIDEVGAFSSLTVGPGRNPQNFITVRMKAKAAGSALFSINEAETAGRGFAIFKEDAAVPAARVIFGTASVAVAQNFTAVNDTFSVNEDSTNTSIDVLANDTIVPNTNTVLSLQSVSSPDKGGSVSISSDSKRLIYTPAPNFNGTETFTYVVRDQAGATGTATVTMQVQAVNDNPVANNDTVTTVRSGDKDVFIDVLSNDTSGADTGETLKVTAVGTPSQGGSVKIGTAGNGVVYTPKTGFVGTETFTYTISDGNGGTANATVTVNVAPAVPPPTVVGESFTVAEDSAAADFDVLANDTPSQSGETLTVISASATNGTATVSSNGTRVRYAPNLNFNGVDKIVYTVRSTNGGTAVGTATMTVTAVNDGPGAVNDVLTVRSAPNQPVDVLKNDTNVDSGETLIITAITQPETGKGAVVIAADGKSLLYTAPSVAFTGEVNFTYTVGDGNGLTATASVKLTVVNFEPRDVGVTTVSSVQSVAVQVQQVSGPTISSPQNLDPVIANSIAKVSDVGPGTYQFSVPTLPFFVPKQTSVSVVSGADDTDSVSTPLNVGTRDARYMDLRDFTSQSLRKGITVAVQPSQANSWLDGVKDWRSYSKVQVTLNPQATSLTIQATDASNKVVTTTLPTNDPRVELRGKEGNHRLFRIQAAPSELTFTPVPPATSSSSSSSSASGEGEGRSASVVNSISASSVDSAISQFRDSSSSAASSSAVPPITSPTQNELDQVINQVAEGLASSISLSDFRSPR